MKSLTPLLFSLVAFSAIAAPSEPPPHPVLNLDASASVKVPMDEMVVVLAIEREGANVGTLNQAVLGELNAALKEAKSTPGVNAKLGSVYTHQAYGQNGKPQGWRVRAELVLDSRQTKTLGQLAGDLAQRLQIANVSFRLSKDKRQELEQALLAEAAAAFKQKARAAAGAFGYPQYALREVNVNYSQPNIGIHQPRMLAMKTMSAEAAPVPTDGGDAEVSVTMAGSVYLKQ